MNLPDSVAVGGQHLVFRDRGTPPHANSESHDWAAAFGSDLDPTGLRDRRRTSAVRRTRPVICPASGPNAPAQPERCDDTEYGKGVGGRLTYQIRLRAGEVRTVWFGVGGSATGPADARDRAAQGAGRPGEGAGRPSCGTRNRIDRRTEVDLPGDRLLAASVRWSKQMLAASEQRVERPQAAGGQRRPELPAAGGHAGPDALVRRRLAGLHLAVRHRR